MPSEAAALFRCCHRHRMEAARHVWGRRTKRHWGRCFQKPHTGGRQSYQLFDKSRQADCGAQPAQLPRAHLAANSEGVPALSPGTHPEGGEARLSPAHLCCSEATHGLQRKPGESWQKEIAAHPLGLLPSSGPNQGTVGRSPTGMEQDPVGPS